MNPSKAWKAKLEAASFLKNLYNQCVKPKNFIHSNSVRVKISFHKFSYGYMRVLNPKINKNLKAVLRTAICWECITSAKFQICYRYQVFSLFVKTDTSGTFWIHINLHCTNTVTYGAVHKLCHLKIGDFWHPPFRLFY